MFGIIKQLFIVLLSFIGFLASVVNAPNYINGISLNNQQCLNQPTLINLNPNENTQGLRYYPFAVNLDRFMGSCNTLNYL